MKLNGIRDGIGLPLINDKKNQSLQQQQQQPQQQQQRQTVIGKRGSYDNAVKANSELQRINTQNQDQKQLSKEEEGIDEDRVTHQRRRSSILKLSNVFNQNQEQAQPLTLNNVQEKGMKPQQQQVQNKFERQNHKIIDLNRAKILLKSSQSESIEKEVYLEKSWLKSHIPHIAQVIADVKDNEGVEITINCNVQAFTMIIDYLKEEDKEQEFLKNNESVVVLENSLKQKCAQGDNLLSFLQKVNDDNCLNLLVSANFLGLHEIYNKIWRMHFMDNFCQVINKCQLNLNNINMKILRDIAQMVSDEQMQEIKDRQDKFISFVYKAKVDLILEDIKIYSCLNCKKLLTKDQYKKVNCQVQQEQVWNGQDVLEMKGLQYIQHDGSFRRKHEINKQFEMDKFIIYFRDKYRNCWKEIYLKVWALIQDPLYCINCNEWFCLNDLQNCKTHKVSASFKSENKSFINEVTYLCCMQVESAFSGCKYQQKSGCLTVFHQINEQEQFKIVEKGIQNWLIIKDTSQEIALQDLQERYPKIQIEKPQSLNFEITFAKAFSEQGLATNSSSIKFLNQMSSNLEKLNFNINRTEIRRGGGYIKDDLLYRIPAAQQELDEFYIEKEGQEGGASYYKECIIKEAQSIVRARSPQQNQPSNQIRIQLDVDSNNFNMSLVSSMQNQKKRSLSPQQQKEVQQITKFKIRQYKRDIIRDDDCRSMKLLATFARQERLEDCIAIEEDNQLNINNGNLTFSRNKQKILTSRDKGNQQQNQFFTDIREISDSNNNNMKMQIKTFKQQSNIGATGISNNMNIINSKRSDNSQERRKKSPQFIIKPSQIRRKASP